MKDGDRSASYQGVNQTVSVREQKREDRRAQERQQEQEQRQRDELGQETKRITNMMLVEHNNNDNNKTDEILCEESVEEIEEADPIEESKRKHCRAHKTGTTIHIPHNVLKQEGLISLEIPCQATVSHTIGFLHKLIANNGSDPSKVNLSYTQAYRYRVNRVKETAENVKEGFICRNPAAIHWDGKIMNDLKNQYKCEGRAPILTSGRGNFKLLSAPALPVKSSERAGDLISNSVMNLLKDWNYDWKISSMVFDTTAANTGHLTAACISIQSKLDRALLWCACRRHIGELVINGAWEALGVETSSSPDIKIFKRFRENAFQMHIDT